MKYTITQTEAIGLLSKGLDYVDNDDTLQTLDLTHYHKQMFEPYYRLTPRQRKSLKHLDSILLQLVDYIASNLYKLDIEDYCHLMSKAIDAIQGCKRDPIHLRVCLYQLLALSIKIEFLAIIYLTSHSN